MCCFAQLCIHSWCHNTAPAYAARPLPVITGQLTIDSRAIIGGDIVVHVYVRMWVLVCACARLYVCVCVCVYMCMCIGVYV